MYFDYLEPDEPESHFGLEFFGEKINRRTFDEKSNFCIVPDIRQSFSLCVIERMKNKKIIDSSISLTFAEKILDKFVKATDSVGKLDVNKLKYIPVPLAEEIVTERKKRIEESSLLEIRGIRERTDAEIILCDCERRGFRVGEEYVYPQFNFNRSKTGRFTATTSYLKNGQPFNCMSIHKEKRALVLPRPGMMMATFDMNAIDARSIVSRSPEASERFGQSEDVYSAIYKSITGSDPSAEERAQFKSDFYPNVYAANRPDNEFTQKTKWIDELRETFINENARDKGHSISLWAQEESTKTFCAAISSAFKLLMSTDVYPMFTVHDELVVEYMIGREEILDFIKNKMEDGASRFSGIKQIVKYKTGKSYQECKE